MTDRTKSSTPREGDAHERGDVSDTSKGESQRTQAGQEASKGNVPAEHDREHQSKYGGGGPNGGTSA